jgi:hypothetical protein
MQNDSHAKDTKPAKAWSRRRFDTLSSRTKVSAWLVRPESPTTAISSFGAPTEFKSNARINDAELKWDAGMVENSIHQDDLYVEMTFSKVMDTLGLNATCEQYGEMFRNSKYDLWHANAAARRALNQGIKAPASGDPKCVPPDSSYARLIQDLLDWSTQFPDDWRKVWQLVEDKWDKDDPCPEGALNPFNIDAKLNGSYIAFGLLYGKRDFAKTIEIATRCGQDSDCNPSSAAGVLGVMLGYSNIPDQFKSGILALAATKFDFTDYSFNDTVLWHTYGLQPGEHTLRLVSQGDADPRSRGHRIGIEQAVLYRARSTE